MIKEIGSDFWNIEIASKVYKYNYGIDDRYLLSGRTAIDFIIKDIKVNKDVETAYLPSYCCHTMIEPFLSNGIRVYFYEVIFKDGNLKIILDENLKCDIVLVIQYFGYYDKNIELIAKEFKNNNMIVIEDCTHSIFCNKPFGEYSDYIFSSFRKWTGVEGGALVSCINNSFCLKEENLINQKYLNMRKEAIKEKSLYIKGMVKNKNYLPIFDRAEEILEKDYQLYGVDEKIIKNIEMLDIDFIKQKRKDNAKALLNVISKNECINPIFNEISEQDCPLFVPVYVENDLRSELRKYLIQHSVYCPIHWAYSDLHKISVKARELYDKELSLICDQRYSETEMIRIGGLINNFFRWR